MTNQPLIVFSDHVPRFSHHWYFGDPRRNLYYDQASAILLPFELQCWVATDFMEIWGKV